MGSRSTRRTASHAGSWYTDDGDELKGQMDDWLSEVKESSKQEPCRGLIGPHAGFSYSGPTAAFAYKHLNPDTVRRIFILGPSHHHYTEGCELTACQIYGTPVGDIKIDTEMIKELRDTGKFGTMSRKVDEDEHSMELHLPYIAHRMKGKDFTLVPILVGNLSVESEIAYGKLLAPYLDDPDNFFVISSDFCHWGKRFRFQWCVIIRLKTF